MTEIDLSGVAPLRRAETRRRVQVIREYLGILKPTAADRDAAAQKLGLGTQQFMNLVRAWRLHGSAAAISKAGANAGAPRSTRRRGLPPATRAAAEAALRALPPNATHKEAIAAVHAMCGRRNTRPPSNSMISYLRLAIRRREPTAGGEPGVVIGRAIAALPIVVREGVVLPEIAVAASCSDGRVIAAMIVDKGAGPPEAFKAAASAWSAVLSEPVTIGADDEALAALFKNPTIVSRFSASRLLAKALGRGIDGIRLSYGPLSSTDPKRALRATADEPLEKHDAIVTLEAAVTAHNSPRMSVAPALNASAQQS